MKKKTSDSQGRVQVENALLGVNKLAMDTSAFFGSSSTFKKQDSPSKAGFLGNPEQKL